MTNGDDINVPSRFRDDIDLIARAVQIYELTGNEELLSTIFAAWRNILTHPDFAAAPAPFQADVLNGASGDLLNWYRITGGAVKLDAALVLLRQAIELAQPNSIESIPILNNLGVGFKDRYAHTGDVAHLEQAIAYYQQAAELIPETLPDRVLILNNLGDVLRLLYARTAKPADLDRSIEVCLQALHLTDPDSPRRASPLNNLGLGLRDRYDRTGNLADLMQAIESWQEAVKLTPLSSPDRAAFLGNLGLGLGNRYARTANLDDLGQALDCRWQVLQLTSKTSPYRPSRLNNLGTGLHDRYTHLRELADLDQALQVWHEAAQLVPPTSPDRTTILSNMAAGFRTRFSHTQDPADLTHALELWQQVTESEPIASPSRLSMLRNMGLGLRDHYILTRESVSLVKASQLFEQVCSLGINSRLDEALASSLNWGEWAMERASWDEAARAFGYGLQAIKYLFRIQRSRSEKETWLHVAQGLPANAAYVLARSGSIQSAALTLEVGQARLLSEALARNEADLLGLESSHPELAHRYRETSDRISTLQSKDGYTLSQSKASPTLSEETARAYQDLETAIQNIQRIEGYNDFLAEPDFDDIADAVQIHQPLVYLVTTTAGSLALIVQRTDCDTNVSIEPVWADSFTAKDLNKLLVRREEGEIAAGYLVAQFGANLDTELDNVLPTLGERLIGPVAEQLRLKPSKGLVLIPSGLLGLLPLHAAKYRTGDQELCLLDEFDVSYAPTANVLTNAKRKAASLKDRPLKLTGVGNPLANPSPLRYARPELEQVATLFPHDARRLLYEQEATKEALLEALPGATYVHFSCHAMFDPQEPLNSHLQLADGKPFTLREILECRDLKNARLVVLSACQTAITDFSLLRDEVLGLPASFFQAGAQGVVGTLWSVNDLATMLLMIRFYEYHLRGTSETGEGPLSPDKALRAAQLWLRDITNAELSELFKTFKEKARDVPQQSVSTYALAKEMFRHYTLKDPQGRPFTHPYHWAAFAFFGR